MVGLIDKLESQLVDPGAEHETNHGFDLEEIQSLIKCISLKVALD